MHHNGSLPVDLTLKRRFITGSATPMIQQANYFPKNLLEWDGDPGQVPTLDKTFIWVDTFARWKIVDPLKFFQTVGNMTGAMGRLDDILDSAVRNFVTSYPLIETVRMTNRCRFNLLPN